MLIFCLFSTSSWVFIFIQSPCLSVLDPPSFQNRHWLSNLTFGKVLLHGWIPRICSPNSMLVLVPLGALLPNSGDTKLHLLPWTTTCWLLLGFSKEDCWHISWDQCCWSLIEQSCALFYQLSCLKKWILTTVGTNNVSSKKRQPEATGLCQLQCCCSAWHREKKCSSENIQLHSVN